MRKVIGFELKKLVSRIGIYILVVLLAGLLVAGVFMYNPIERNTTPSYVDYNQIKNEIREELSKFFYHETETKPMIIAVIQEV